MSAPKPQERPSKEEYYFSLALAVAMRSTCLRRKYGAVIVKDDRIISTGYNGAARGEQNCTDVGRPRGGERHPERQPGGYDRRDLISGGLGKRKGHSAARPLRHVHAADSERAHRQGGRLPL